MMLQGLFLIVDIYVFQTFIQLVRYFVNKKRNKLKQELIETDLLASVTLSRFHKCVIAFAITVASLNFENELGNFILSILKFVAT